MSYSKRVTVIGFCEKGQAKIRCFIKCSVRRFCWARSDKQIHYSGVIRVGVTGGDNWGCHPYFFMKKLANLLVIAVSAISSSTVLPLFVFSWKTDDPFLLIAVTFIDFTRVSLPGGCYPHLFLPVRPPLSTILCKFAHNFFPSGVTHLEGVTLGGLP